MSNKKAFKTQENFTACLQLMFQNILVHVTEQALCLPSLKLFDVVLNLFYLQLRHLKQLQNTVLVTRITQYFINVQINSNPKQNFNFFNESMPWQDCNHNENYSIKLQKQLCI